MAQSPAHRFGQIIGETLERAVGPVLEAIAGEFGLYLDSKGQRKARGAKRKVEWVDGKGNAHDLDFVLELGGSEERIGSPRAFVEIAWRRYTKHSRNKAQEIHGAIVPLAERYSTYCPFLGVILGGVFTEGSLSQLRSNRFTVLHFPYESIMAAFASAGIDAEYGEDTPDSAMLRRVKQYEKLTPRRQEGIAEFLRAHHQAELNEFTSLLRKALGRRIESVYILPLHGTPQTLTGIDEAVAFIERFDEAKPGVLFTRYEVGVRFSNGEEIRGQFNEKATAIAFLRQVR